MAYERVGPEGEEALTEDLRAFLEEANTAGERALVLEAEYLEVIASARDDAVALGKQIKDAGSEVCSAHERLRTPRCAA